MRIGALIPVRLSSERLPGKALMDIEGRPVIAHLIDRIAATGRVERENIIVATTEESADDPLVPVVEAEGARVFRGHSDDIIDRFYKAVDHFGFDAVIQADGDDPCTDAEYMARALTTLLGDDSLDIVIVEGLPLGVNSKAIRGSAVKRVWEHHVSEQNDTGFISLFTKTGLCKVGTVEPDSDAHRHDTARLTLDYTEDLEFFRAIFAALYAEGKVFGVEEIVSLLNDKPELLQINGNLDEDYWSRRSEIADLTYRDGDTIKRVDP